MPQQLLKIAKCARLQIKKLNLQETWIWRRISSEHGFQCFHSNWGAFIESLSTCQITLLYNKLEILFYSGGFSLQFANSKFSRIALHGKSGNRAARYQHCWIPCENGAPTARLRSTIIKNVQDTVASFSYKMLRFSPTGAMHERKEYIYTPIELFLLRWPWEYWLFDALRQW